MLCHLTAHSCYSLLEAIASPRELVEEAARHEMPVLGLTDHLLLTGAVEFYLACKKAGIQPVLGLEVELGWGREQHRIALLAGGPDGWANLCRVSSYTQVQGEGRPVNLAVLAANAKDIIVLVDDIGDPAGDRLSQLAEIFRDHLYVSLPGPHYPLVELAGKMKLPVVAAPPVFYRSPEQAQAQRVLSAIRTLHPLKDIPAGFLAPSGSYFLSKDEFSARFQNYPQAVAGITEVAERCRVDLPVGKGFYPDVAVPKGLTVNQFLRRKAEDGARALYGRITRQLQERLDHELEVIGRLGFEPVFLIVDELLRFAREQDIPTASRGSASSSLVAHCLGITTPDPIALDLYFERFLNPARQTPPDIDTDICSRGRDQVIQHVFDTYGEDRVAMVCTINRFRPRSALSDVAKAHGMPPEMVRRLAGLLPHSFWARRAEYSEDDSTPVESPFAGLAKNYPEHRAIFRDAEVVLGLPRHLSVHPGGLVVTPGHVTDRVPVTRSGSKGVIITQMDLESVEALGLVKIDLLGIRGLTVLGDVAGAIHSWRQSEFRSRLDILDSIPDVDADTATRVEHGQTIGCFQIESPGMRAVLREIHARTPQDIMAALALYRPGPLQGGLKDAFVRRFKGEEPIVHLHPALEPLLSNTFGVILYQEQVLQIANRLAGFTLSEGDLLRRAMSHFDPGRLMQELKAKFIAGAEEKSGVSREMGEQIWDLMAAFAGYGFPKAHAASYAQVGWRSAWCKTHFPAEFMAAVMANWGGYYSQRIYLSEARRMGLKVRPPHINHSLRQFCVTYPQGEAVLFMGLDQVKDLTQRTQERIIRGRPFASVDDFLTRVDPRPGEAEALVKVGGLRELGSIPELLERVTKGRWEAGQMSLFAWEQPEVADWSLEEKVKAQEELLGTGVDAHPLELVADSIAQSGAISTIDASVLTDQRVRVAGLRMISHRSQTARGEWMMFMTLEDLEGLLDVAFFPDVYRRFANIITSGKPILVTGVVTVDAERGEPLLRAERVDRLA